MPLNHDDYNDNRILEQSSTNEVTPNGDKVYMHKSRHKVREESLWQKKHLYRFQQTSENEAAKATLDNEIACEQSAKGGDTERESTSLTVTGGRTGEKVMSCPLR